MRQAQSGTLRQLNVSLNDVEVKIKRQLDAIEAGAVDLELIGERLQALKAEKNDLTRQIAAQKECKPIPSSIHSSDNIRSIQENLKELFLSPDSAIAKSYTKYLVDEIRVKGTEVHIQGNKAHFVNTLAQKNNVGTGDLPVPTLGIEWLPVHAICENWVSNFILARKVPKAKTLQKKSKSVLHPIHRAVEFQRLLDSGAVNSRAGLAKKFGISRARVTQLLNLLQLDPEYQAFLLRLRDVESVKLYSERKLRAKRIRVPR